MNEKRTDDETTEKVYIKAEMIADTRDGEQKLGFRNIGATERRMLFQAGESYVELLIPPEGSMNYDGGWLFGQFIRQGAGARDEFAAPIYAVLQGPSGLTGAAKLTEEGEFAVPFQESGQFSLSLEPRDGPTVRLSFTH